VKTTTGEKIADVFAEQFGYFPDRHACRTKRVFGFARQKGACPKTSPFERKGINPSFW
jgi:hypothetical protein